MTEKRKEFEGIRRKLQKEVAHGEFICARCGTYSESVNLHHIMELWEGGDNRIGNLIPLCESCHREWDLYKGQPITFEEFLITPTARMWALMISFGVASMKGNIGDLIVLSYYARFSSFANRYAKDHGETPADYYNEFERQNSVFSAFPYSDLPKMLSLYGGFCEQRKWSAKKIQENQKRLMEKYTLAENSA